jgi:hypothetical protein
VQKWFKRPKIQQYIVAGGGVLGWVIVLLILFIKIPAKKSQKITVGRWDKRFSNRRYCKHHPNVDGCQVQK